MTLISHIGECVQHIRRQFCGGVDPIRRRPRLRDQTPRPSNAGRVGVVHGSRPVDVSKVIQATISSLFKRCRQAALASLWRKADLLIRASLSPPSARRRPVRGWTATRSVVTTRKSRSAKLGIGGRRYYQLHIGSGYVSIYDISSYGILSVSWEDQGRQDHGHFGNGTSSGSGTRAASRHDAGLSAKVTAIAYTAKSDRTHPVLSFDAIALGKLQSAMIAWNRAAELNVDSFRDRFIGPFTSDHAVILLRKATQATASADSHADLREAGATP